MEEEVEVEEEEVEGGGEERTVTRDNIVLAARENNSGEW